MAKLRLAIGVPWYSEFVWTRFTKTALNLKTPDDCEVEWFFPLRDGWCAARRHNDCLEQARLWNADLILILGADQTYQPDMLQKLVKHHRNGCDVVVASVPIRGYVAGQNTKPFGTICWRPKPDQNGNMVVKKNMTQDDVEYIGPEHGDLVQVFGCGSGVILFPSEGLVNVPPPWFSEIPMAPTFERRSCADWPFVDRLLKNNGYKMWCDTTIKVGHIHPFVIDETFPDRFPDWADGKGDISCCDTVSDGKIRQVRVSPSIPFFDKKFKARYKLTGYSSAFNPSFFFGCYTPEDLKVIQAHAAPAFLIWAGSDAAMLRKGNPEWIKNAFQSHVKHIAISKFIAEDLDAVGLKYTRLPLCCVDESKFKPVPKHQSNKIFAFVPEDDREKYGGDFIEALQQLLPEFEFLIHTNRNASPEDMAKKYAECFIGVRPLAHDGLSNTVVELGLSGRSCLWNGDSPNAIAYTSLEDAAEKIRAEHNNYNHDDVAQRMQSWLDIGEAWKNVAFYEPPKMKLIPEDQSEYDYANYFNFRYEQGPGGAGGPDPNSKEVEVTNQLIVDLLKQYDCKSVTEVGCGSCFRWKELPSENYTGVDISEKALEYARAKFPKATFEQADLASPNYYGMPISDAIICIDVMQHIRPEHAKRLLGWMRHAAKKVLIVKTTMSINESFYQFNNDKVYEGFTSITGDPVPPPARWWEVPTAPHSRIMIWEKTNGQESLEGSGGFSGEAGNGIGGASGARPSDVSHESDSCAGEADCGCHAIVG